MFSHNLAKQLKQPEKVTITRVLILLLLASVITICVLQVFATNSTTQTVKPSITSVDNSEPDNEQTKQDCTQHENEYVLLGITLNQQRVVTLVRQTLTNKALFITNDGNSANELSLVSANLTQAMFQMYSCQFTLFLPKH